MLGNQPMLEYVPPQMRRRYDPNCQGYYYLNSEGQAMYDPNCIYKGTGPISGDMMGLAPDGSAICSTPSAKGWGIMLLVGLAAGGLSGGITYAVSKRKGLSAAVGGGVDLAAMLAFYLYARNECMKLVAAVDQITTTAMSF